VAAGKDERGVVATVLGAHRDPGEVDAVQHVGVDQLGGKVEGHDVEGGGGTVGLQREQRQPAGPELGFEVDPGCVGAFGARVGPFVEDLVEDLEPLVGEADLVGVGIEEQPGHLVAAMLGRDAARFHPDVASGFLNPGQQWLDPRPQGGHLLLESTGFWRSVAAPQNRG